RLEFVPPLARALRTLGRAHPACPPAGPRRPARGHNAREVRPPVSSGAPERLHARQAHLAPGGGRQAICAGPAQLPEVPPGL
ncbi:Hypothetical predicted protein, partial [Olea europaea subsp. europaea]